MFHGPVVNIASLSLLPLVAYACGVFVPYQMTENTKESRKKLRTEILFVAICETGWIFNGGFCYAFKTMTTSWQSARDNCISNGADLIVIKDSTEANFVYSKRVSGYGYWLGLTDLSVEGI